MKRIGTVRNILPILSCIALGAALAVAEDVMAPEISELRGAKKIILSFSGGEDDAATFTVKSAGADEQKATRQLPSEGLDRWKLALVAGTDKSGDITGYSLVTWKPAEMKPENEWPQLKEITGATARVADGHLFVLRRLMSEEKGAKWTFEIISFRRIEAGESEDPIVRAKKETIEEGSVRYVESGRSTLVVPSTPDERTFFGVLLTPVWKEEGRTLEGFDAQLVSTPAPAPTGGA